MKIQPSKQKTARTHSYEIAAALLAAVFIIPSFVLAQPAANPPGGNVDATFNSVTVNDGVDDNLVVNSNGIIENTGPNNSGRVIIRDDEGFSIFDSFSEIFNFSRLGLVIENTGIILNAPGFGGMSINNAGSGGLTVNATTGGLTVNATTGGVNIANNGGVNVGLTVNGRIQTGDGSNAGGMWVNNPASMFVGAAGSTAIGLYNAGWRLLAESNGRIEIPSTTDASGSTNTGALEIGNALRLDSNEIITNSNTPLYIQHNNNGDLFVDNGSLTVDASANNVGINDANPSYDLDVTGNLNVTNGSSYVRAYGSGSLYNTGVISSSGNIYSGGNVTAYSGYMRAGAIGRFYTNDGGPYNPRNDNNVCHYSSSWGSTPNDYCAMYASCSGSGDVIVGMMTGYTAGMGTAGGWQYVASGFSDSDTGYIVFYSPDDNNSAPTTVYSRAVCFSPNG